MTVVTVSDCRPACGDLTKWLFEINTGVYVGNLPARVREELWKRICDHLGSGYATMVYNTSNERVCNSVHGTQNGILCSFDGISCGTRFQFGSEKQR